MSSGMPACRAKSSNDIPTPAGYHRHVVTDRNVNYSAFNGYRATWSRYSLVRCMNTGRFWRTAAAYVKNLPDALPHEDRVTVER